MVRPLQIKDHLCMWEGGGVYNRQYAAVNATCGFKMRGCRCSPVGPCRAPDPSAEERERLRELRTSRAVKSELAWNIWPNRLVLRRSLHSENETNDLLKSGPALAGPAGPATPPLGDHRGPPGTC